jgi:hypothetical protein
MKVKSALFLSIIYLTSCHDDKLYKKRLNNGENNVDWYHYSYITSTSNDYVVVKKGNREEHIFEHWELEDIILHNDTITLLHLEFQTEPVLKKDGVFGYKIIYKEVDSYEMYRKHQEAITKES